MSSIAPPNHTRGDKTTDSWVTPQSLIERLGQFDLDPCASTPQPWPCADRQYTVADDGLSKPWHGLVYCNPPYGRQLGNWLSACRRHGNAIALIFARTETEAFFDHVWPYATAVLFVRKRLTFYRPDGTEADHNAGGPSVLVAYGSQAAQRLKQKPDLGAFVKLSGANS